jgi:hypothetical protein
MRWPIPGTRIVSGQTARLEVVRASLGMSALGQKQTSRPEISMSALLPKADMDQQGHDVRYVPIADIPPFQSNRRVCGADESCIAGRLSFTPSNSASRVSREGLRG